MGDSILMHAVNILHISDWHANEAQFADRLARVMEDRAEPDLLVMSGDMIHDPPHFRANRCLAAEDQRLEWELMNRAVDQILPGVDRVAVPGNHDWCNFEIPGVCPALDECDGRKVIIAGGLRIGGFRGVPGDPERLSAWDRELRNEAFGWLIAELPKDLDLLLVHAPPYGVLDGILYERRRKNGDVERYKAPSGIPGLAEWCANQPRLRAVCFGHIHEEGGKVEQRGEILFSNASCRANWLNILVEENA
jgi:Icc-related predicted phosphoesterase